MLVNTEPDLTYTLVAGGTIVLDNCRIGMSLSDGVVIGSDCIVRKDTRGSRAETIEAPFYRQSTFQTAYNYLSLRFEDGYTLQVRAYDDGVAYRFVTSFPEDIAIVSETQEFNFAGDYTFISSFASDSLHCTLPVLVRSSDFGNIILDESDLEDYPGMLLTRTPAGYTSFFPDSGGQIAKTQGSRAFPWRIIGYAPSDRDIPVNNMVYQTASASRLDETSWIVPGHSTWDLWNGRTLYNVDFKSGINTETYKYHIDFAAQHSIEYVTIDRGWHRDGDPLSPADGLDMDFICSYASDNEVGLILGCSESDLSGDFDRICRFWSEKGIDGFKLSGFGTRDQQTVRKVYEFAEIASKYRMILDLRGVYAPTDLMRTYPNIIAGDMISDQGAMIPMKESTRAQQIASYIVFDSPFAMLCDSPSAYLEDEETTGFICSIPPVFRTTEILDAEYGTYTVTKRTTMDRYFIGGLTGSTERDYELKLSFLPSGTWTARIYRDGANADKVRTDHVVETLNVNSTSVLNIHMAPGGGFAVVISQ